MRKSILSYYSTKQHSNLCVYNRTLHTLSPLIFRLRKDEGKLRSKNTIVKKSKSRVLAYLSKYIAKSEKK